MARGRDSFAPNSTRETYKDVLIFEERLKQNAERLQSQKRKYEVFLGSLIALIVYLIFAVFIRPSIYSLVHYGNVTSLLVALVTLALFFATGMYSDKIAYAYKFVPQANRALRPFNIYLNTRTHPRFSRFSFNSFFRLNQSVPPIPPTQSPVSLSPTSESTLPYPPYPTTTSHAPLSRRTSSSSSHSSTSVRSLRGNRSPPGSPVSRSISPPLPATVGGINTNPPIRVGSISGPTILAPIPPASNPRGELIFSSRVAANFREGYEKYRGEWEKRRGEQLNSERKNGSGSGKNWFKWMKKSSSANGNSSGSGSEKEREVKEGKRDTRERGRSASISSSKPPSRQSSPLRLVNARTSRRNSNSSTTTSISPSNSLPGSPLLLDASLSLEVPLIIPKLELNLLLEENESNGLG